jgi:GNAT superfamily N-acetyltransferase
MEIELLPASVDDQPFFRDLHHAAYRPVIEAMFGWVQAVQDEAADREFRERRPRIIRSGGRAVGAVGLLEMPDHLWFGPLYILPEFQRRGIGTLTIGRFMRHADEVRLPLRLRTLRNNLSAKKLYERLGFETTSATELHWYLQYAPEAGSV